MSESILVPIDGSEYSLRALDVAISLAKRLGSEIVVCNVIDLAKAATLSGGEAQLVAGSLDILESDGQRFVDEAVARAKAADVAASSKVVDGEPVEQIERIATAIRPSFIVIGTRGRSGLNRLLMGSVAEGVVRRAIVPVMVVPPQQPL